MLMFFVFHFIGEPQQVQIRLTPSFTGTPTSGDDVFISCEILIEGPSPYPPPMWKGPDGQVVPRRVGM